MVRIPGYRFVICDSCGVQIQLKYVMQKKVNRFCGLVVMVSGYRSRGPGSIPELPDFLRSSGSHPREYN
jgi:hypothetical protein